MATNDMVKTRVSCMVGIGGGFVKVPIREEFVNIPTPTSWIAFCKSPMKGTIEWLLMSGLQ